MPKKDFDEKDKYILRELLRNSKQSKLKIAKKISLSNAALSERIKKLEKNGYINGYGCRVNYTKLGFEFMAVVEIHLNGKNLIEIEEEIAKIPSIGALWDTTGEYDAITVVMCKNREELSITIKKILAIKGVEKTNTNVVLNVVKRLTEFDGV